LVPPAEVLPNVVLVSIFELRHALNDAFLHIWLHKDCPDDPDGFKAEKLPEVLLRVALGSFDFLEQIMETWVSYFNSKILVQVAILFPCN